MNKNPDAARRPSNKDIVKSDTVNLALSNDGQRSNRSTHKSWSCLSSSEREIIKDAFNLTMSVRNKSS